MVVVTSAGIEQIDGRIRVPAVVNLHDHLRSYLPTGRAAEHASLDTVISAAAGAQAIATDREVHALTALGAARALRAGTTTVVDHVYPLHRPGLLEAVTTAHAKVGLRGLVAVGFMTRGDRRLLTDVTDAAATIADAADRLLPREQLYLAPVSLRQNGIEDYRSAALEARRLGVGLYTHIAETRAEVEASVAEHGLRPVRLLHSLGFLTPATVLAHAIELDDEEIALCAETGTTVVYCPTNHARLGKRVARVVELLEAGVRVTLGVDGAESVFHEMRAAIAAQSQATGTPGVLGTDAALAMGTSAGVAALAANGLDPGALAHDSVLIDATDLLLAPVNDPTWTLVHRAGPAQVLEVVVDGRTVVADGRLSGYDENDLIAEASEAVSRFGRALQPAAPPATSPQTTSVEPHRQKETAS